MLDAVIGYIARARPDCLILENVRGYYESYMGWHEELVNQLCGLYGRGGTEPQYRVEYQLLNAKEHGSPQSRTRIFYVGLKRELLRERASLCVSEAPVTKHIEDFLDPRDQGDDPSRLPPEQQRNARRVVEHHLQRLRRTGGTQPVTHTSSIATRAPDIPAAIWACRRA